MSWEGRCNSSTHTIVGLPFKGDGVWGGVSESVSKEECGAALGHDVNTAVSENGVLQICDAADLDIGGVYERDAAHWKTEWLQYQ